MGNRIEAGVIIVGTGFSGIGMAVKLRQEGREDFVVIEKADEVGGTWRDNTYPGCACDVQSHMYSFSFEQNPDWSRAFSPQPEIYNYLRSVARKHDLYRSIHFGQELTGATWNEETKRWHVRTGRGDEFVGKHLIAGVGALHIPQIPELPGAEKFEGPAFHSAQWDHDVDLRGKKVAVVGTGASAIQFVPQIAKDVEQLTLFQRTPPWIMPKPDREMPGWLRTLFSRVPGVQRLYRNAIYWALETRAIGFNGDPRIMKVAQKIAERHVGKQVRDPELRAKVTPDYVMGCKRVLISNDYYPSLNRDNVDVVTDGVAEVTEHSVIDKSGVEHEADVIIYGTGFHVTDAFDHLNIVGAGGQDLGKLWATEGMQTHKGITVSGFPNLFFLLGPNTGLGHNSVVFMIEQQSRYISEAITYAESKQAEAIEVRPEVQDQFNADIQRKLDNGIWSRGGCTSWYLDSQGVNRTVWPGFTWKYWMQTRKLEPSDYSLVR